MSLPTAEDVVAAAITLALCGQSTKETAMSAAASIRTLSLTGAITSWAHAVVVVGIVAIVPPTSAAAGLKITSPAERATIADADVTVTIELADVTLVRPDNATKKDDVHVIFALDVDTKPFLEGTTTLRRGPNVVHATRTSITFKDVAAGPHNVTVILVYSDHTAAQPPVASSVSFVVAR